MARAHTTALMAKGKPRIGVRGWFRRYAGIESLVATGGVPVATRNHATNRKGRDIGYALAASSCEGANRVEACTVTAPDAITAFAVPNPNSSSQSPSVFSGPVVHRVAPAERITQLTSDRLILFEPTLSAVDGSHTKFTSQKCQRRFSVQTAYFLSVHNRNVKSCSDAVLQPRKIRVNSFSTSKQQMKKLRFAVRAAQFS